MSMPDKISITVNGVHHSLPCREVSPWVTLNEYLRNNLQLIGTKFLCNEGGCGCCVVAATVIDPAVNRSSTFSINSCLIPVLACNGWAITTVEGLGNRVTGYHEIQKQLAAHNGTQCGYCSPGFVMGMYGLLQRKEKTTAEQIENNFDGNICRCTGYRSILDAMKTFAVKSGEHCENCGKCEKSCSQGDIEDWLPPKIQGTPEKPKEIHLKDGCVWCVPETTAELLQCVEKFKGRQTRFVVGNTSVGVYKEDGPFEVWISTRNVADFYQVQRNDGRLEIGANITLSQLIEIIHNVAEQQGFAPYKPLAQHFGKIANVNVRNAASWAGNLMMKHKHHEFPSDVFILLEIARATLSIASLEGQQDMSLLEFLEFDMTGKVIVKMSLPQAENGLGRATVINSYKVTPRSQCVHTYVSGGFSFCISPDHVCTAVPKIVYAGINSSFCHALKTENYFYNKCVADPQVLAEGFRILCDELVPDSGVLLPDPKYIRNVAVNLLYRFILELLGDKVPARLSSGAVPLVRPVSSGQQDYDTDQSQWPVTQPMTKLTAINQTAGEAEYCLDIPQSSQTLWAAFVCAKVGNATIESLDPSQALAQEGVVRFVTAKDIPAGGVNNYSPSLPYNENPFFPYFAKPRELFCTEKVEYAGQPIGVVVAHSLHDALKAANMVKVNYSQINKPVLDIREAIDKNMIFDRSKHEIITGDVTDAFNKSAHVFEGELMLGSQHHFTMETQSCVAVPKEGAMEVYPTSQWLDASLNVVAQVLGYSASKVKVEIRRVGGGFGGKAIGNLPVTAACALAAHLTNRPVKLPLSLNTNMEMIGRRYPFFVKYKIGVNDEGKLNGIWIEIYCNAGHCNNDCESFMLVSWVDNVYYCPNWHISACDVKTNTPPTTYCRGPAPVPGIFIIEAIMEHVARVVGKNPVDVKSLNFYQKNQVTPSKQLLSDFDMHAIWSELKEKCDYDSRFHAVQDFNKNNRWKKRGISLVPVKYGCGFPTRFYNCIVTVYYRDGSVSVAHGGIELGQGINVKVAQICAHTLGIPLDKVNIRSSQDITNANSFCTGGSTSSEMACLSAKICCEKLLARIEPIRKKLPEATRWEVLIQNCYNENIDLSARHFATIKQEDLLSPTSAHGYHTYGVACSEVELDVLTGENQILRTDILFDCGESVNPEIDIGQIEGAFVMGIGYHLLEKIVYDPETGRNLANGTWDYHPPTTKDIPIDFRVHLLKNSVNHFKFTRSKAIGEPPLCSSCVVLFALQNAIEAARLEVGNKEFFAVGPPTTVDKALLLCLPDINELKIA